MVQDVSRGVQLLDLTTAFPATSRGGDYAPQLAGIRGARVSGVYAIAERRSRRVLYVGESHTGRLYDTITRHFREWRTDPRQDAQGRRRGGTMYNRLQVLVAYVVTEADVAQAAQFAEISRLRPRDNQVDGLSVDQLPV